jgi:hypothetical protein
VAILSESEDFENSERRAFEDIFRWTPAPAFLFFLKKNLVSIQLYTNMADTDQTLYSQVEDAFFGILWTLQTTRKNDLVNLNILTCLGGMFLDFCHMLAFFVYGMSFFYLAKWTCNFKESNE